MENEDIKDKTETGQKKWMDNKIKRDIYERMREPFNPNSEELKMSLDCKTVTKSQLHG